MENKDYIVQIDNLNAEQIAEGISKGIVTFEELRNTGDFDASKQKGVEKILNKKDEDAYHQANTTEELETYISLFPYGIYASIARERIKQIKDEEDAKIKLIEDRKKLLSKIKEDINEYVPDEIIPKLSEDDLEILCQELGFSSSIVKNYKQSPLIFNDIPASQNDIPQGYTNVFFWGIPSSGKTCALAAILNTIKKKYTMEAPDCEKKFGIFYRDSLIKIFQNDLGYLPGRTSPDQTQYMPFLLSRRTEKNKRKISFFELSGEVFKYFYEVAYNSHVLEENGRDRNKKTFNTLNLLLNSNNQNIHFFFIDYNQETKHMSDKYGLTQSNYLEAAATYFRDNSDIFKRKTDAVYVVITKSDEIKEDNKTEKAKMFLNDNFGSFMDVLKNQCEKNSISLKVKLFSIGNVYFKSICKIDRSYSQEIIEDLLTRVKPDNNSLFKNIFNS